MINFATALTLRFKTVIGQSVFFAEVECADVNEVAKKCGEFGDTPFDVELVAALIYLDTSRPTSNGCYILDDESVEVFEELLSHMGMTPEHFVNQRIGYYDRFNNTITPTDLGISFPDGSIRVIWDASISKVSFDNVLKIVKGALELLFTAQEMPYFQPTEDEIDNGDDKASKRRSDLLFEAGFWPNTENEFDLESTISVTELLSKYTDETPESVNQP